MKFSAVSRLFLMTRLFHFRVIRLPTMSIRDYGGASNSQKPEDVISIREHPLCLSRDNERQNSM